MVSCRFAKRRFAKRRFTERQFAERIGMVICQNGILPKAWFLERF
jgi:hypothetical protein